MSMFDFAAGRKILIEQAEYRLARRLADGAWQIEHLLTGAYSQRSDVELLELYRCDKLAFIPSHDDGSDVPGEVRGALEPDLSSYESTLVAVAKRYVSYLREIDRALDEGELNSLSNRELQPIIEKVAVRESDLRPPTPVTMRRAHKKWVACGRDIRSQVPRYHDRGRRDQLSRQMEWLISCSLQNTFLTPLRKNITRAYDDLIAKINAINSGEIGKIHNRFNDKEMQALELEQLRKQVEDSGPLKAPSLSVLYRRKNKMSDYDITVAQMGKMYADAKYRTTSPAPKPTRPLEEVQGDETVTDLFVIDEMRRLWLGRALAVILFDVFIRGCYGAYIGFEPHSLLSYMNAIRHGILPKTYIASEYPEIKNRWDIHGRPRLFNFDNTMAVHSKDFEEIGYKLNTTIIFDLPRTPWFKALVERFFRQLNDRLLHQQLGTTFSHFAALEGDYDPVKNAIVPYSLLLLAFHKFVVDIHLQSWNDSIMDTPAGKWKAYEDKLRRPLPPRAGELDIILGRRL